MKNVKNRSKFHEKMAVFCHYFAMNGKLWVRKKFSTHIQCQKNLPNSFWYPSLLTHNLMISVREGGVRQSVWLLKDKSQVPKIPKQKNLAVIVVSLPNQVGQGITKAMYSIISFLDWGIMQRLIIEASWSQRSWMHFAPPLPALIWWMRVSKNLNDLSCSVFLEGFGSSGWNSMKRSVMKRKGNRKYGKISQGWLGTFR